jgi:branched-chain amino acid transport system ATP-binding protein
MAQLDKSPKKTEEDAALTLNNVVVRFGGLTAVDGVSMSVKRGAIVGLIGPNGAGKTTAFNVVTGFYKPFSGYVEFTPPNAPPMKITGFEPHKICAAGIARTFQNIRLFGNGTVLENVMTGAYVRQKSKWWMNILPIFPGAIREEREIRRHAAELLERLGLTVSMDTRAASLPYGAQRRLEIARALATKPSFLLLDEPAAGINPQESAELLSFIRTLRDEFDLSILLIEHDMKVVMGVCEHIWVLDEGRLIADGDSAAIRGNPRVIEAYLGKEAAHA